MSKCRIPSDVHGMGFRCGQDRPDRPDHLLNRPGLGEEHAGGRGPCINPDCERTLDDDDVPRRADCHGYLWFRQGHRLAGYSLPPSVHRHALAD